MKNKDTFKKLANTRFTSKTPKFFRIIRNIGLVTTGFALFVSTAPVSIPATIVTIGSYAGWIGGTAAFISQFAKE